MPGGLTFWWDKQLSVKTQWVDMESLLGVYGVTWGEEQQPPKLG